MKIGNKVYVTEKCSAHDLRGLEGIVADCTNRLWKVHIHSKCEIYYFLKEEIGLLINNPCSEIVDYAALKQKFDLMEISKKHYQAESIKLYDQVEELKKTNAGTKKSLVRWMNAYFDLKTSMQKVLND